ncbi:AHL_G0009290.mRNA.1.CDS.1 [Saccharomyces cerevisiae]|uniref:Protein serine/threonine kinase activating protein DBF4 n=1 Tax=Saccharomyces paradoxus TaxID=27291 RepID=A0A8B8UNG2_SACPA|nr:Dbf4 [Saccharomyces paradoxus]CAI4335273.1 AVB_G0009050.mRNA.1.CDS.1 [Saccharomyces cerevisiae]QHS72270.1 Dbf4 [Saccharomyces paradoxus]CAI4872979.1 AHL_G0009290.mRNA.1.CDS.1 [Saccharomyces cerevisiae]CAI6552124.1 AHL_G0009290.mRNA.1.CDS.1 [Saccharomyces cerevisiae]CAI7068906.1 AVB_G0009050.mRNA.1.CDS.1 [Saccharomyces cerevisiae]
MVSPTKMIIRSPLKETDTNLKHNNGIAVSTTAAGHLNVFSNDNNCNNNNTTESFPKKRSLERLELQQQQHLHEKKRAKLERARSIEGAVQVSKGTGLKNVEPRVTPKELLEWQTNWKKIMKRDSRIYFDITDDVEMNTYNKSKMDKRRDLLKRGFLTLGAQITQFFDTTVTIVITRRSVENIYLLKDTDILSRAKKNYMKVWSYEKAARFLKNLDVDLDHLSKTKSSSLATPTLSNLLHNEKLYGPTDRDPRTKRDDIHYFKYPHVYLYDLWQTWAPIITLEWKPQELTNLDELPYPILKMGSFGRCPFIGDRNYDESSYKRVVKRYSRDKANKKYALQLRALFQYHADTLLNISSANDQTKTLIFIPHTCNDSTKSFKKWMQEKAKTFEKNELKKPDDDAIQETHDEHVGQTDEKNSIFFKEIETKRRPLKEDEENKQSIIEESNKYPQRKELTTIPKLNHPVLATFTRQETEEVPDDLCTLKTKSRQPFEIKASGAHQSNDVATSFGNGLGPTRASVMSKNMKSLSRLMVDRKLGVKQTNGNNKNYTAAITTAAETSREDKHRFDVDALKKDEALSRETGKNNAIHLETNSRLQNFPKVAIKSVSADSRFNNDIKTTTESPTASKKTTSTNVTLHPNAQTAQPVKKETVKNSGYCENCRVKYESLEQHIVSEKHLSFAENDLNFEAIDSLIENLRFQI